MGNLGRAEAGEHWLLELSTRQAVCQGCRTDHGLEGLRAEAAGIVPSGVVSMKLPNPYF